MLRNGIVLRLCWHQLSNMFFGAAHRTDTLTVGHFYYNDRHDGMTVLLPEPDLGAAGPLNRRHVSDSGVHCARAEKTYQAVTAAFSWLRLLSFTEGAFSTSWFVTLTRTLIQSNTAGLLTNFLFGIPGTLVIFR